MAQKSTKEVRMYLRIRNLCGLLGILLPWIALFSAGIRMDKSHAWWWSISATYYQSDALVGVLVPACIVLMSWRSWGIRTRPWGRSIRRSWRS